MRSVSALPSASLWPRSAAISSPRSARRRSTSAALASAKAAIHVGGLGFGLLTLAERLVHVLTDAGGAGGEERSGVLADEVSQEAGEEQEIGPLEGELVLVGEAFFFLRAGVVFLGFVLLG